MTIIAAPRINFPTFTTPLIGRDADVSTITTRLRRSPHRFATLVGTSGTGKTRLSMQIAAAMEADTVERQGDVQGQGVAAAGADVAGGVEDVVVGDHQHAVDHIADALVGPAHGEGGIVPELVLPGEGAAPGAVGFEFGVAGADAVVFQRGGGDEVLEVELADFAREREAQLVVGGAPVSGRQVLPGPLVGEGRAVAQRRCGCLGVGRITAAGLGEGEERQAKRHGRRQPMEEVVHVRSLLGATRRCWSAMARAADARAPSGLARRPPGVRCFGEGAPGRPTGRSVPETRGRGT